jgi:tRNA(Ile)-lysidine synthase
MTELTERVAQRIRERRMFRAGERIVVAVSGGLDSMVLLRVLCDLAPAHRWQLVGAHFNHRLRGGSSDADQRLVTREAARLGVPLVAEGADVRAFAARQKLSIEMGARQLRHEFLAKAARAHRCRVIALAHHADDQVELFFLRLLRGAGMEGLAGMPWDSRSPADRRLTLARPFLECTKAQLSEYAHTHGVAYREDASNAVTDVLRNRIRHELLPLLKARYQPALPRVILRQMEILRAESACLDEFAAAAPREGIVAKSPEGAVALQRRRLRRELMRHRVSPDFDLIERLRLNPGKAVSANSGIHLRADKNGHVMSVEATPQFLEDVRLVNLERPERSEEFASVAFRWVFQRRHAARLPASTAGREWFDLERVGSPIFLRHWRPGDRFQPVGMNTPVKLQDLFTNQKVPGAERHQRTLATTASGEIWWVEGLRIGERFKVTPLTRERLGWTWRRRAPRAGKAR